MSTAGDGGAKLRMSRDLFSLGIDGRRALSLHEAQRNAGQASRTVRSPDCVALHPGYGRCDRGDKDVCECDIDGLLSSSDRVRFCCCRIVSILIHWINAVKRLPAAFYALSSGREPVREWLRRLMTMIARLSARTSRMWSFPGRSGCLCVGRSGRGFGRCAAR